MLVLLFCATKPFTRSRIFSISSSVRISQLSMLTSLAIVILEEADWYWNFLSMAINCLKSSFNFCIGSEFKSNRSCGTEWKPILNIRARFFAIWLVVPSESAISKRLCSFNSINDFASVSFPSFHKILRYKIADWSLSLINFEIRVYSSSNQDAFRPLITASYISRTLHRIAEIGCWLNIHL